MYSIFDHEALQLVSMKNLREKYVLFNNQEFHYAMEYENFLMFDALLNEPGIFENPDKKLYNYK